MRKPSAPRIACRHLSIDAVPQVAAALAITELSISARFGIVFFSDSPPLQEASPFWDRIPIPLDGISASISEDGAPCSRDELRDLVRLLQDVPEFGFMDLSVKYSHGRVPPMPGKRAEETIDTVNVGVRRNGDSSIPSIYMYHQDMVCGEAAQRDASAALGVYQFIAEKLKIPAKFELRKWSRLWDVRLHPQPGLLGSPSLAANQTRLSWEAVEVDVEGFIACLDYVLGESGVIRSLTWGLGAYHQRIKYVETRSLAELYGDFFRALATYQLPRPPSGVTIGTSFAASSLEELVAWAPLFGKDDALSAFAGEVCLPDAGKVELGVQVEQHGFRLLAGVATPTAADLACLERLTGTAFDPAPAVCTDPAKHDWRYVRWSTKAESPELKVPPPLPTPEELAAAAAERQAAEEKKKAATAAKRAATMAKRAAAAAEKGDTKQSAPKKTPRKNRD